MSRADASGVLFGQDHGDLKELGELEQALGGGDDQPRTLDHVHELALQVDDHHNAAVHIQEFHDRSSDESIGRFCPDRNCGEGEEMVRWRDAEMRR